VGADSDSAAAAREVKFFLYGVPCQTNRDNSLIQTLGRLVADGSIDPFVERDPYPMLKRGTDTDAGKTEPAERTNGRSRSTRARAVEPSEVKPRAE
jgi:hypothetical protein